MNKPMTSKERIERALKGMETDRIPFSPNMAYVWDSFPEEIKAKGLGSFLRMVGADPLWRGAPCPAKAIRSPEARERTQESGGRKTSTISTPAGEISMSWELSQEGKTWFLVEHPIKSEKDCETWRWLEESSSFAVDLEPARRHLAGDGAEGLSVGMLLPRCKTSFQCMAETLFGTEELCYALADYPDAVESLLETMVRKDIEAVKLALGSWAPYEWYITWEDSSTQNYSPEMYKRYIAPEIAKWNEMLSEAGKKYMQHACGHVKDLLSPMKESGIAAIESVSPPPTGNIPLKDVRKALGPKIGIVGGIEPTKFLSMDLQELGGYIEQVIEDGSGGPFVLANSDSCPPGVSVEKFKLAADIVRRR